MVGGSVGVVKNVGRCRHGREVWSAFLPSMCRSSSFEVGADGEKKFYIERDMWESGLTGFQ